MPDGAGVLSVFYPLKTRVFRTILPIVQNLRKMANFHLATPLEFSVNILFSFVFRIYVSKFEYRVGYISRFKT